MYTLDPYLYILNKTKHMQNLSNFLLIYSIVLFILILSKSAKLFTDYLLTKIK